MLQKTPLHRVLFPRTLAQGLVGGFVAFMLLAILVISTVVAAFVTVTNPVVATAATNSTLNFQARLERSNGSIVPDGYYHVTFRLYDGGNASGGAGKGQNNFGSHLWTEMYTDSNGNTPGSDFRIQVRNGYLSTNLGSLNAFPSTINWDEELWITMEVGGTDQGNGPVWDGEMNPRLKLTGVPYAFKAGQLAMFNSSTTFTSTLSLQGPTVGNQNFVIQNQGAAGTYNLCVQNSAACGFAPATGSANYVQNQNASQQLSTNYWISGTGRADTALQAPSFDTATAVALNVGTTNATSIVLGKAGVNTRIAANLSVGTTQSFGAITIANDAWFSSVDAAGTGSINMFKVNGSNQIQVGAALNIDGGIVLPSDHGPVTIIDSVFSSSQAAGTDNSYTFGIGQANALTVFAENDGAGNAQNVRVGVGSGITPAYTLDVAGDININSGSVYRINGQQICSINGCATASGSGSYIQNGTASQTGASFNVQGANGAVTAVIQGASGTNVDIFQESATKRLDLMVYSVLRMLGAQ